MCTKVIGCFCVEIIHIEEQKTEFNGCQEFDVESKPLTGTEILQKNRNINYVYGKKQANTMHVENSKKKDKVR